MIAKTTRKTKPRRKYHRDAFFPVALTVKFPADLAAAIEAEADAAGVSISKVVRVAVSCGLPVIAERNRRAENQPDE